MIITKLDQTQSFLIAKLDPDSPSNVFIIENDKKYEELISDDSSYCIVFYSGWYGEHIKIITDLFKNTIPKFSNIKFGFKVFTSEDDLHYELKKLYKGSIGKVIFILIKNKKIFNYFEQNLKFNEVNQLLSNF
ncbi:MAG: hypothetical protein SFY56_11165 [Bacteroidota bacterium]|nr:hypothetical protein [Bacteroidota bacterium]